MKKSKYLPQFVAVHLNLHQWAVPGIRQQIWPSVTIKFAHFSLFIIILKQQSKLAFHFKLVFAGPHTIAF